MSGVDCSQMNQRLLKMTQAWLSCLNNKTTSFGYAKNDKKKQTHYVKINSFLKKRM